MSRTIPVRQAAVRPGLGRRYPAALRVALLTVRLIRRGVGWLVPVVAFFVAVEVFSYEQTYPDAASRQKLAAMSDDPAVRMLQGIPHAVDTAGGFVAWDAGWMLAAITGVWALLAAGRLLRGEEESGRAELVLAGPIRPSRVVLVQVIVLAGAVLAAGASAAGTLALMGAGGKGSVVFGLGLAGFAATFAGVAAVLAQLLQVRRRVTAASAAVFGVFFLLRMAANSADSRGWLRWFTPFGWLDDLQPYHDPDWSALTVLLAVPAVLASSAIVLRSRRDTADALINEPDRARARMRGLGSPLAFARRGTRGMLAGWLLGIAGYAFVAGALIVTAVDLMAEDPNYQRVLGTIGWDAADVAEGFAGVMGILIGLLIALYACWRIGAARAEEAAGRLDHVLARPVGRGRWLGGHVVLTLASALLLGLAAATAMWAGAAATGAGVGFAEMLGANLNPLPVAVLATGLAVLVFGIRPRLTVPVSAAAVVVAYLVEMIGPALDWPDLILDVSPFHHLASVPAEPFEPVAAAVMVAVGVLFTAAGHLLFERRDLTGD
ncbi:ABC transporter permease subunit [Actinomadura chokoriensis]|uniref:ABC transporter permease subunit n=1 Tax=Actinomadura chokoriensis TaxID=454156 RepID=UPI0031F76D8B